MLGFVSSLQLLFVLISIIWEPRRNALLLGNRSWHQLQMISFASATSGGQENTVKTSKGCTTHATRHTRKDWKELFTTAPRMPVARLITQQCTTATIARVRTGSWAMATKTALISTSVRPTRAVATLKRVLSRTHLQTFLGATSTALVKMAMAAISVSRISMSALQTRAKIPIGPAPETGPALHHTPALNALALGSGTPIDHGPTAFRACGKLSASTDVCVQKALLEAIAPMTLMSALAYLVVLMGHAWSHQQIVIVRRLYVISALLCSVLRIQLLLSADC